MRRFQWDDSDYRATKHLPTLTFVDDIPGGVRCVCGFCKDEIDIVKSTEDCPKCHNDLIFPRCDW